jgi:hypothetical protein
MKIHNIFATPSLDFHSSQLSEPKTSIVNESVYESIVIKLLRALNENTQHFCNPLTWCFILTFLRAEETYCEWKCLRVNCDKTLKSFKWKYTTLLPTPSPDALSSHSSELKTRIVNESVYESIGIKLLRDLNENTQHFCQLPHLMLIRHIFQSWRHVLWMKVFTSQLW